MSMRKVPAWLWDYGLVYVAPGNTKLVAGLPKIVTGDMPDISEWVNFKFYNLSTSSNKSWWQERGWKLTTLVRGSRDGFMLLVMSVVIQALSAGSYWRVETLLHGRPYYNMIHARTYWTRTCRSMSITLIMRLKRSAWRNKVSSPRMQTHHSSYKMMERSTISVQKHGQQLQRMGSSAI